MSTTDEQSPRVSQLAWAAFICALIVCIPLLGVVAIVLGSFALGRIRNSNGALGGRRIALVAMALGAATTVGWFLLLNQIQSLYQEEMNSRMVSVIEDVLHGSEAGEFERVRNQFTTDGQSFKDDEIAAFGTSIRERWGRLLSVAIIRSNPQGDPLLPRMAVTFELEFERANPTGAATLNQ